MPKALYCIQKHHQLLFSFFRKVKDENKLIGTRFYRVLLWRINDRPDGAKKEE
jgi:hypothetical protein